MTAIIRRSTSSIACRIPQVNITVFDDVIVPNGANCMVDGATIVGSVTLEPGNGITVFVMESGVITGSFVATGVNNGFVSIGGGAVLGDVEVGGQGMVGGVGARVGRPSHRRGGRHGCGISRAPSVAMFWYAVSGFRTR